MSIASPLIPVRSDALGPLTRGLLRRCALVYGVLALVGLLLAQTGESSGTQAFGLGLVFPGGGFVHFAAGGWPSVLAHVGCLLLSFLLFVISLLLWFGTGNQLAPLVAWLGSAMAAWAMAHEQTLAGSSLIVSALAATTLIAGLRQFRRNLEARKARLVTRNATITDWPAVVTPLSGDGSLPRVGELSPEDLAALRFALDRALQPVDAFDGFDIIEQFQPSALRYQINNLGYVLSLANYTHLPAMHAWLHEAQRNLIEKKKAHRVWQYWGLENLWGNFSTNADPVARDNVMYSGWYAAQLGLYEAVTGDRRYQQAGAITLEGARGQRYVHDYPGIVRQLVANEAASPFCLFPCEPNWIYPLCNNQAVVGIKAFDRAHGTHYWRDIEASYRGHLEREFIDVDGHMVLIRSTRTGFTIPGLSSSKEDAIFCFWMHAVFPDLARRLWAVARAELFADRGGALALLPLKPWLDPGNYRFNTAYALGALGMAAAELGDDAALAAVRQHITALPAQHAGGVLSYPGCSIWTHAFLLKTRLGRANALADLVSTGMPKPWREGPVIAEANYPDLLVARAVSDGVALDAVCYPGRSGGVVNLGIGQLRPGVRYRCEGTREGEGIADARGQLGLTLALEGRLEVKISPLS